MVGGRLAIYYALGVTALTCALAVSAILHESELEPKIVQVTDVNHDPAGDFGQISDSVHRLLGTATERRFWSFMRRYGKEYSTREEYVRRLGIFAVNLIRAAEHQALDPTAVHGVTPFSDLSEAEFEALYTGVRDGRGGSEGNGAVDNTASVMEVRGLPDSFDWRERGAVTEVKMQVSVTLSSF
ncbi:putative cysteine protease rd19d [Sarracenia purpurea var. burkii]